MKNKEKAFKHMKALFQYLFPSSNIKQSIYFTFYMFKMRIHKLLKDMEDGKAIFPSIPTSVDVFSFFNFIGFLSAGVAEFCEAIDIEN